MRRMSLGILLVALAPVVVGAQDARRSLRPAIGVHAGYASVEKASNTLEVGVFADVGSFKRERVRLIVGLDVLSSESNRDRADGDFRDVTVNGDLRYKPFNLRGLTPYLGAGLGLHFRSTTATDPDIKDIYDGLAVGAQGFLGALYDLADDGAWGASAELRRVMAQNVSRSSLRIGLFRRL